MWIKVIIIAGIAGVTVALLRPRGSRSLAIRRLAMVGFGGLFAASVIFPSVWSTMADVVGVGRGTDLLLYLFILVMLAFVAATHLHFRGVEAQVTMLARRIALAEAPRPDQAGTVEPEADRPGAPSPAQADDGQTAGP